MTKKTINDYLKEAGADPAKDSWKLDEKKGGKTIVKHAGLEKIASHLGIEFESPMIVNSDYKTKPGVNKYNKPIVLDDSYISMIVTGTWNDRTEWSTGEASPANCMNAYPWSIAEKRGKDRVILKLLRVHGEVYSEIEAEEAFAKEQQKEKTEKTEKPKAPYIPYNKTPYQNSTHVKTYVTQTDVEGPDF